MTPTPTDVMGASAKVDVLATDSAWLKAAVLSRLPLPEPRAYAWYANAGWIAPTEPTRFTEDEVCPFEPDEWSHAAALYDADALREYARATHVALVEAAKAAICAALPIGEDRGELRYHPSIDALRAAIALAGAKP